MSSQDVEGPVEQERQVPQETRIQLDFPAKPFMAVTGTICVYSGYLFYHTLKAYHRLNKEV